MAWGTDEYGDLLPNSIIGSLIASGVQPEAGRPIGVSTPVSFGVVSPVMLRKVFITLVMGNSLVEELVHDGTNFSGTFAGPTNSRVSISGGYTYTLLRDGGWRGSVYVKITAVDSDGNAFATTLAWPLVVSVQ